jgi:hypothetical protein
VIPEKLLRRIDGEWQAARWKRAAGRYRKIGGSVVLCALLHQEGVYWSEWARGEREKQPHRGKPSFRKILLELDLG